jgi:hypothetical protein
MCGMALLLYAEGIVEIQLLLIGMKLNETQFSNKARMKSKQLICQFVT